MGRLIITGGVETAENIVEAVPFANRFEVAYSLQRHSCQEKDVVAYLTEIDRQAKAQVGNMLAAAEVGLPLICSGWEAAQTLPLAKVMFSRIL